MSFATSQLSSLYDAALALVYPQICAVCGQSVESRADGIACSSCWKGTEVFSAADTLCWKCGAFTSASVAAERRKRVRCGKCDGDAYSSARAIGFYKGALRASILSLKREPHVPQRVAQLMLAVQRREPINHATLIVPVPLHPERQHQRGFNQAAVLAASLSRLNSLPCDGQTLIRRVHTSLHRAGMDSRARRGSVAGAFHVREPEKIEGESVLLIDDVFTTGATASACAAVLRDAGARDVFVLTVGRA